MNAEDKQTHYDLLHKIEKNDRRFRTAQTIFMSIIGMILVGLVAAQFLVISNFQAQSAERAKGLKQLQEDNKTLSEANKHLNEQTNRYVQCIARFFATTDRQTRVLTDLDKCSYEQNGQSLPGLDITPSSSLTPAPTTQEPTTPVTISPTTPGLTPVEPEPAEPAEPAPFKVLGIPVCVPFTNVCVRR